MEELKAFFEKETEFHPISKRTSRPKAMSWFVGGWNAHKKSKEYDNLKESYCRLIEECIHLKEQRDEAIEIISDWIDMEPETEHEIYLSSVSFLARTKA